MMSWAHRNKWAELVSHAQKIIHNQRSCFNRSKRSLSMSATWQPKIEGNLIQVSEEVQEAIMYRKAVVALESTIITHGMPYPHNYSTALSVEKKVRQNGAVPATIAVLKGKICIGLQNSEIGWLAENSSDLVKVSRRDLPFVLSHGFSGGTTVSATMIAAHIARIPIFATGGIGGVHRGAETSFDVSADLTELGRTPVAVVSSGVKSILDIPKTLEYLETQGVCVAAFGEKKNFPAFFTQDSGYYAPYNVATFHEAAKMIEIHQRTGLNSGMLIAVPIPDEFAATGEVIQDAIDRAVESARKKNITGKEVTPYILNLVNKITKGESLSANIALVDNNASVAAGIANYLAQMRSRDPEGMPAPASSATLQSLPLKPTASPLPADHNKSSSSLDHKKASEEKLSGRPVVIGATVLDFSVQVGDPNVQFNGATYQGAVSQSCGGVGRNLADCLSRLQCNPLFISAVGMDSLSDAVSQHCKHIDMQSVQTLPGMSTATYCPVLLASGQLLFGVGNMDINSQFPINKISDLDLMIKSAPLVLLDGNFTSEVIEEAVCKCADMSVPVWFEPTDLFKSVKPFETEAWKHLTFISPNLGELITMYRALMTKIDKKPIEIKMPKDSSELEEIVRACVQMCLAIVPYIPVVLLTLGKHGVLLCHRFGDASRLLPLPSAGRYEDDQFKAIYYKALNDDVDETKIVSVSGAGDCFASAFIAGMLQGFDLDLCMKQGFLAAYLSLQSMSAVPETLSAQTVMAEDAFHIFSDWRPVDVSHGISNLT